MATYKELELGQRRLARPHMIPHLLQDQIEQGSLIWFGLIKPVREDLRYLRNEVSHGVLEKLASLRIEMMLVRFNWQLVEEQSKVETGRLPADVCVWNVAFDPLLCEGFELLLMITQEVISHVDQCTVRLSGASGLHQYSEGYLRNCVEIVRVRQRRKREDCQQEGRGFGQVGLGMSAEEGGECARAGA